MPVSSSNIYSNAPSRTSFAPRQRVTSKIPLLLPLLPYKHNRDNYQSITLPNPLQLYEIMPLVNLKSTITLFSLFWLLINTFGCATRPVDIYTPLSFESAVRIAAGKIFKDGQLKQGPLVYVRKPLFVIDQIVNSDTGEATVTCRKAAELAIAESRENFPNIIVEQMNSDNVTRATYIIVGVLSQELNTIANTKIPHLFFSLLDAKSGQIVSSVDIWIANRGLSFEPTPVYKDSPMYIRDNRVAALIATAKAQAGALADTEYFDTLETSALLDEAGSFYDKGNFSKSLALFARAVERTDGKVMRTFAGLYQNFIKMGKVEEAKVAFFQLLYLGIADKNLSIKFLFKVDSTEFYGSPEDLIEYAIWVEEIAEVLKENGSCVEVIGHASKSGSFEYNNQLSLRRASAVQKSLSREYPAIRKMTKSSGRGFTENIIGTGTNDFRDAIDRRVEFKIIDCKDL